MYNVNIHNSTTHLLNIFNNTLISRSKNNKQVANMKVYGMLVSSSDHTSSQATRDDLAATKRFLDKNDDAIVTCKDI